MKTTRTDFSRFLFRATGPKDHGPITDLLLVDNLNGELERLRAIEDLLCHAQGETIPPGLHELIRDIRERSRALLDLFIPNGKKR